MNELARKAIIDFASISITVFLLLVMAEYSFALMTNALLLGFMALSVIIAIGMTFALKDRLQGMWGNSIAMFVAVIVLGLIWTGFSATSVLFVLIAVPSAIISAVIWKVWKWQPSSLESEKASKY